MKESELMDEYILNHIDEESDYLKALYRETQLKLLYPHMASGHLQGRLLKMLVSLIRPKRVLEIGTYSGYSTLCMAEGLDEDGMIYTFDVNDEIEDFTRQWFDGSPYGERIKFTIGNALEMVPQTGLTFDMAYVDGDKRQYVEYYEMVIPLLPKGGCMIADNTLWDAYVLDPVTHHDRQTRGIMDFNDHVAADTRVEKVILPLRDGLTLIRKK